MANLLAASEWTSPCLDRENCLSQDRIKPLELYEHRKRFQTTVPRSGGTRVYLHELLEAYYGEVTKTFSRSFVVGPKSACGAAAMGLDCRVSVPKSNDCVADVRLTRVKHAGRCNPSDRLESVERMTLEAHIRELQSAMKGDKVGDTCGNV
eukprot:1924610-Pleurochrysis_carterae.AAC.3